MKVGQLEQEPSETGLKLHETCREFSTTFSGPGDVAIDTQRRKELLILARKTTMLLIMTFCAVEFLTRFLVFVGKPALSSNKQYDAKYLVAGTVSPLNDNIVLCGDSLVKQGLYPELITAQLQKLNDHIRVVNLAVNGGQQADAIAYLDYLRLFRCTKPRLVVFDFEVAATGGGTTAATTPQKETNLKPSQQMNYLFDGMLKRPTSLAGKLAITPSDYSFLIRHRGTLKHLIIDFLSIFPNIVKYDQRSKIELCNVDDDATTFYGMSPDHNLIFPNEVAERSKRLSIDWPNSPRESKFVFNPKAYAPIIEYCQKQQIPLMLVWLPHQKTMYNKCWYRAPYTEEWFRAQFENYAKELFVFPVYINRLPEDCTYYSDYRHLSTYGCMKASELLGEAISQPKYRSLIEHAPALKR